MKKKLSYIALITGMLCGAIGVCYLFHLRDANMYTKHYEQLTYLGTEEEFGDIQNVAYYQDTGGENDADVFSKTDNFVLISGEQILQEAGFDYYAISSLDEYLLRYINYYIGNGVYYATISEGSATKDTNYPSFTVIIENERSEKYYVHCTYRVLAMRYSFSCEAMEKKK